MATRANPSGGAEQRWEYSLSAKRYRDSNTGRFVPKTTIDKLQDDFIAARQEVVRGLASALASGDMTVQDWAREMRDEVKLTHIGQYLFGRGGRNAMTDDDWARVSRTVREQYEPLHDFTRQIANGELSEDQIAYRASNYVDAARASFNRGFAEAKGWPELPAHPGDGSTTCYGNCRCEWSLEPTEGGWNCTWNLGDADHCQDCIDRSEQWAPLFIASTTEAAA